MRTPAGALDLKKWECGIPGKEKTDWAGGFFKLELTFPDGMLRKDSETEYNCSNHGV